MPKTVTSEFIKDLTYACYRYNRLRSPDITPDRWRLVFGPMTDDLERDMIEERGEYNA